MENNLEKRCPCFSGKKYIDCCKQFHDGANPENALLVMRSRYSAYALNLPRYIIETTHPTCSHYSENKFLWEKDISQFAMTSTFQNLEIHDFKEKDSLAEVTFTAYLSQDGHDVTFTEKSYFEKNNNRWLYQKGQLAKGRVPDL